MVYLVYFVSFYVMEPTVWGPIVWTAIHLICFGANETLVVHEQESYQQFFNYLALIIPCASCRLHLKEHYKHIPLQKYLNGREKLFEWSVLIHNMVNESLGKPAWSLEKARDHWEKVALGQKEKCVVTKKMGTKLLDVAVIVSFVLAMISLGFIAGRRCK